MNVPRWMKIIAYPSWFLICLVAFLYLTFPMKALKSTVENKIEGFLGKGRFGQNSEVKIGTLDTYYLSGLSFERLAIRLASQTTEPGVQFEFDEANVRIPVLALLFGSPTVEANGVIYDGQLDAALEIANAKMADERLFGEVRSLIDGKLNPLVNLKTARLDVEGLKLDRAPPLIEKLGLPVAGTVNLKADLDLGNDPTKEGKGSIVLKGTGLSVGEGKLPIAGGFSVPYVDLGVLDAEINIAEGKGKSKKFTLTGRDVTAEIEPSIRVRKNVLASNLTGPGWFKLSDSFLKENGKFKAILFDFPGPQKAAKDDKDRFHFALKGSLKSPGVSLSKTGGKAKSTAKRSRSRRR